MKKEKRRDYILLILFLLITLAALGGIKRIYIDSGTQVFIPENHEIKEINEKIEEEFGLNDSLIMGVQTSFASVLEPETLRLIDTLTRELESHPLVRQVRSLTNMDYIESAGEDLVVSPVLEEFTPLGIEEFKRRINDGQEIYWGTFISEDLHMAAIVIQPQMGNTDQENGEIYSFLRELARKNESEAYHFPIAGLPVVKDEINRSLSADIIYLIPVAAGIIMLILFLSFRRWEGVVFPLICLAVAGIWVMGLIGYLKITFTMATLLVPVLLLVVGSAYAIHVLSHFYEGLSKHSGTITPFEIREILRKTLKQIGFPVILAGLTTAGGFIALVSSPLGPFRAFGLLSAVGVVFSQITSLILLPLMIRLRYSKNFMIDSFSPGIDDFPGINKEKSSRGNHLFSIFEIMVKKGKSLAVLLTLLFVIITVTLLPRIESGSDMLKFFVPTSSVVKDAQTFNDLLGGSNMVTLMITAPKKGDILTPSFLGDLESFSTYITSESSTVSQVQSVIPSLKRINQLMNAQRIPYEIKKAPPESLSFFEEGFFSQGEMGDNFFEESEPLSAEENSLATLVREEDFLDYNSLAKLIQDSLLSSSPNASTREVLSEILKVNNYQGQAFYEIPRDPAKYGMESEEDLASLLSQYLVFYSGNLGMVINDALEPDRTLVTIQVMDISFAAQRDLREKIDGFWDYHLPQGWEYKIGGGATLAYILSRLVTQSQYYSLLGALLIVWALVSIMFRSPAAGLYGMIPVLFSLTTIFMTMALLNFKLDIITSLLASLAIGIGVDYAIHFMDAFKFHGKSDPGSVLNRVYRTTGWAIFINAMSVAFGFLSLMVSRFIPIRQMGILFSVAMISACFSSLLILPMALEWGKPAFLRMYPKNEGVSAPAESLIKGVQ